MNKKIIHNSSATRKGNIWLFWSISIKEPVVISNTKQAITVDVGGHLVTDVHGDILTIHIRVLWEELFVIATFNKPWMIIGDFNAVLSMEEKGRKKSFNYFNLNSYPSWGYKVGTRGTSDHSPLFGTNATIPKPANVPFRALKVWMSHEDFKKVIEEAWKTEMRCNSGFIFLTKLKHIKVILKKWNCDVFGDVNQKLKKVDEEVLKHSLISDQSPHNTTLLNNLVTSRGVQEILTQQKQEIERPKARVKWLKFGAANTKFFHVNMKIRQMHNAIVEMEKDDGELVLTQQAIADILVNYFDTKFKCKEVQISDEVFEAVPKIIQNEDNQKLESLPSATEIKQAVFDLDPNSFPGPDGFGGWF
ncbi:uncharacterized protein LOC113332787 [Papaver somniferum]|uniref:uncharacterized protein LOC113332787 n=1 Tax=Papaver somniferum TaxID=3469 RepID=UPI000E6FC86D|nr:uncharacterized protein LOC113332787 [Papaver somniferum]